LRCVYKEAGSLVALGLREAPAESGRATDTAGYVCPYLMTSPLHNYSGSSSGHGNATPDQVRSDRETLKYVPDGLLECPEKTHHFRLVWSLV
jgi:hypothetical protein